MGTEKEARRGGGAGREFRAFAFGEVEKARPSAGPAAIGPKALTARQPPSPVGPRTAVQGLGRVARVKAAEVEGLAAAEDRVDEGRGLL